ncbi:type II toxin-antitoxin system Phd/YefM family antitoxin [Kumtagia ephedrae]|uniref:Antitoxin n=1 Tax=Kumtagia ephedrae TaxID=2116701 RepID=A0A2P7SDR5_9HYPH|nr:type II toxin-antitoxin system prevent-host-death family antitoxin [Mesorhizobium ephedrae]PSJ60630.1 type II toxin-antitoxin system prevent-host-death family antitoxin [Mesorhizobium ephedrae]
MHVGTFEAKNRLSSLLDMVVAGEEVTITRNGKPIARLVPVETRDLESARSAAEGLRAIRARSRPGPESLKDLVNEGRRY